ncbi:MAG: sigma-54-dependent Fis family transcriptional regulator, partial [Deltaproteobacteria bacterium]|nr:sigma-54-dependent Fis family transcriptional regulator [Deltaproteobacteria bacterium]
QEREFFKVGGKEPVRVDVRIIAATNQDIAKLVSEKRFREDLLFRLNGVTITIPPLSERKGDIKVLAGHFLEEFSHEFGSGGRSLSDTAIEALEDYHWPGNVRELENVLRKAVLLSSNVVITPEDLSLPQARQRKESLEEIITAKLRPFVEKTAQKGKQELYDLVLPYMERPLIKLVIEKTRGNQVQAAEVLGINRNTLRKKIKKLNIKMPKTNG